MTQHEPRTFTIQDCHFCGATGEVWHHSEIRLVECPKCKGSKVVPKESDESVRTDQKAP